MSQETVFGWMVPNLMGGGEWHKAWPWKYLCVGVFMRVTFTRSRWVGIRGKGTYSPGSAAAEVQIRLYDYSYIDSGW